MGGLEVRHAVLPALGLERRGVGVARALERRVDQLPRGHVEARMLGAQSPGERANDVVVGAGLGVGLDHAGAHEQVAVAAAHVDVVVLEEGRGRQHDVGVARRVGHELLVHREEEIVPQEALAHLRRFGRDRRGD